MRQQDDSFVSKVKQLASESIFYANGPKDYKLRIIYCDEPENSFTCIDEDSGNEITIKYSDVKYNAEFYKLKKTIVK